MTNQPSDLQSFVKALSDEGKFYVLDTETTGLDNRAEICEIAIVCSDGTVVIDRLVRPTVSITDDAARITGITNEVVKDAETWLDIEAVIKEVLRNKLVVTYNATFDRQLLHQSDRAANLPAFDYCETNKWYCAMIAFAERYGEFNAYRGNYKWQKLSTARNFFGIAEQDNHRALGDALTTLDLCKVLVAEYEWGQILSNGQNVGASNE
jgi:DNA polymerase-3 subunit epsilon